MPDLAAIVGVGHVVHPGLPEEPEVYAEKFTLFPDGCFVLTQNENVVGYCLAHPWLLDSIPALNRLLTRLPASPNCLFVHDVAVLEQARGQGAAKALIEIIVKLARNRSIPYLALVSVYGTYPLWGRFGFEIVDDAALAEKLKAYGGLARYMVRRLA